MKIRFIILTLVLLMIFSASCAPRPDHEVRPQNTRPIEGVESSAFEMGDIQRVKITADKASVRTGCTYNSPVLQTTNKGNTLDVVSQVADWYAVRMPNNQIGFVPKQETKPVVVENKTPQPAPASPEAAVDAPPAERTNVPGSTAVKTPDAQTDSAALSSQEQEMLRLLNAARAQNNLPALQIDMKVTNVARIKSQDMIDNNYFSHNSPKYGSPFDMMKSFNISYVQAGENIAGNQTVQNAHNALMNSPGHRKNILSPDFTHIGIGIKKGGQYGNMFTQMFVSKPK